MGYGAVTFGFAYLLAPERIFSFPRSRLDRLPPVISLYSFLSVLVQEIADSLLFFERNCCLLQSCASAILLSAVVFAAAPDFTRTGWRSSYRPGGELDFAWSYVRTSSLLLL